MKTKFSAVLVGLLAVLLGLSSWFAYTQINKHRTENQQQVNREQALAVAQQFIVRMRSLDTRKLTAYRKSLEPLLTSAGQARLQAQFPALKYIYKRVSGISKDEIRAAGIESIDADSAAVLVIHDYKFQKAQLTNYVRSVVQLEKVNGNWLVDQVDEVTK